MAMKRLWNAVVGFTFGVLKCRWSWRAGTSRMNEEEPAEKGPGDPREKRGIVSQRLRQERQAEELRANLKRRKERAREISASDNAGHDHTGTARAGERKTT
jgi:hypothetical protein